MKNVVASENKNLYLKINIFVFAIYIDQFAIQANVAII